MSGLHPDCVSMLGLGLDAKSGYRAHRLMSKILDLGQRPGVQTSEFGLLGLNFGHSGALQPKS